MHGEERVYIHGPMGALTMKLVKMCCGLREIARPAQIFDLVMTIIKIRHGRSINLADVILGFDQGTQRPNLTVALRVPVAYRVPSNINHTDGLKLN
jgi:hypothetical protein